MRVKKTQVTGIKKTPKHNDLQFNGSFIESNNSLEREIKNVSEDKRFYLKDKIESN